MKLRLYFFAFFAAGFAASSVFCMNTGNKVFSVNLEDTFIEENNNFANKIEFHDPDKETFYYELKKDGNTQGGLKGEILFDTLYIKYLVVGEKYRGKVGGLGAYIMKRALDYSKRRKLRFAFLETFSFQAVGFYKKLGFEAEFIRSGLKGRKGNIAFHHLINRDCGFEYDLSEKTKTIEENNFSLLDVQDAKKQEILEAYMKQEFDKHYVTVGQSKRIVVPFSISLEDENKEMAGIAKGKFYYDGLRLQELIVNSGSLEKQKELLNKVVDFAKSKKLGLIYFDTLNENSAKFYAANGFEISYMRDGYKDGVKHYYMAKYLKNN